MLILDDELVYIYSLGKIHLHSNDIRISEAYFQLQQSVYEAKPCQTGRQHAECLLHFCCSLDRQDLGLGLWYD